MKHLVRLIFILLIVVNTASCSNEESESDLAQISIPTPLTILVDRTIFIDAGDTVLEFNLTAPWSVVNFQSINNSTRMITVIGGAYIITDPLSGTRKVLSLESTEGAASYEGVIFPSRDTNCDGFVSDAEATAGVGPSIPCTRLRFDPSDTTPNADLDASNSAFVTLFDERQFYLTDMGSAGSGESGTNEEDSVAFLYRGLTFAVSARVEGWFGTPDRPLANFSKEIFFTTRAD